MNIEDCLSYLVDKVRKHFDLNVMDAVEAVSLSKVANQLSRIGHLEGETIDEVADQLFKEISHAE